jgi:hypothetical protein
LWPSAPCDHGSDLIPSFKGHIEAGNRFYYLPELAGLQQCPVLYLAQSREVLIKGLFVLTGAGVKDTREWVPSATTALQLVRSYMKLRRPSVRIEDERGNSISFLQLKDMAELEDGRKMPYGPQGGKAN